MIVSDVMTELHEAASLGDLERLEEALRNGLNPNEPDPEWSNRTPLHIAASKGLSKVYTPIYNTESQYQL